MKIKNKLNYARNKYIILLQSRMLFNMTFYNYLIKS